MKEIIFLGATGNGLFMANMINQAYEAGKADMKCIGFINDEKDDFYGFPILGRFKDILGFLDRPVFFIMAIGVDSRVGRRDFVANLEIPAEKFATFVHPSSFLSSGVRIGRGVFIGPNATINYGTQISDGTRIMPSASIGTHTKLGNYSFISVNSCIADSCVIGPGCHVGLSALVSEGVQMGDSSLLGMGSILQESIGANEIWVGNPAKFLKKRYK